MKMMKNTDLIKKYVLDITQNKLKRLDEISQLENIDNGWDKEKYFSFDPVTADEWMFNFYGRFENMHFKRVDHTNYFVLVA